MTPIFSFLIPTRHRRDLCIDSINTIQSNCQETNKHCFELLFAIDEDDIENGLAIINYCKENNILHNYVMSKRYGYYGLHHYYNSLAKIATGTHLWIWNDDAKMCTYHWDSILIDFVNDNKKFILDFETNNPIPWILLLIPKKYIDAIGHFALNNHVDTWLEVIFDRMLGIGKKVPGIKLHHLLPEGVTADERSDVVKYTVVEQFHESYRLLHFMDINRVMRSLGQNSHPFPSLPDNRKRVGLVGFQDINGLYATALGSSKHIVYGCDENYSSIIRTNYSAFRRILDELIDLIEVSEVVIVNNIKNTQQMKLIMEAPCLKIVDLSVNLQDLEGMKKMASENVYFILRLHDSIVLYSSCLSQQNVDTVQSILGLLELQIVRVEYSIFKILYNMHTRLQLQHYT